MIYYIGIDVQSESCTVAIMTSSGNRIRQEVLETDAQVLRNHFQNMEGTLHICFEEGNLSEWLFELLEPLCDKLVVVQPQAGLSDKSDSLDAWALANQLWRGCLPRAVFKAPHQFARLRNAVRTYEKLLEDSVRAKNRLKAACRSRGIGCKGKELYDPETRKHCLKQLRSAYRPGVELMGAAHDGHVKVVVEARKQLLCEA